MLHGHHLFLLVESGLNRLLQLLEIFLEFGLGKPNLVLEEPVMLYNQSVLVSDVVLNLKLDLVELGVDGLLDDHVERVDVHIILQQVLLEVAFVHIQELARIWGYLGLVGIATHVTVAAVRLLN